MAKDMVIRALLPADFAAAGRIFFCAVHEGTRSAYSAAERLAWAGPTIDLDRWQSRIAAARGFVAEVGGESVGFITIDRSGYVDLAFVLPSMARHGIGRALLAAAESHARTQGARQMTTEASLIAAPFFSRHGWDILHEEVVMRSGIPLRRFRMQKVLR